MSSQIDFDTWYSPWMKSLAKDYSKEELERRLPQKQLMARAAGQSHLRSIQATGSMSGQSMRRAHARNTVSALGDEIIAIRGAIEIHELFPERAKQ